MRGSKSVLALVVSAAMLGGLCSHAVLAQTARSGGGGGQSAQLMQQLQQLASERTTLQAEQTKMKKELEDLRKERDALKAGQAASTTATQRAKAEVEAVAARAARDKESTESELTKTKARMEELVAKFRETATTLREVETDRATEKDAYAQQTRELTACVASNNALYDLNDEVLARFENQGFWSSVAKTEPFTKLKRVQLENLIDGYRTRANDKKYIPGAVPAAPPAPPPTTSR